MMLIYSILKSFLLDGAIKFYGWLIISPLRTARAPVWALPLRRLRVFASPLLRVSRARVFGSSRRHRPPHRLAEAAVVFVAVNYWSCRFLRLHRRRRFLVRLASFRLVLFAGLALRLRMLFVELRRRRCLGCSIDVGSRLMTVFLFIFVFLSLTLTNIILNNS